MSDIVLRRIYVLAMVGLLLAVTAVAVLAAEREPVNLPNWVGASAAVLSVLVPTAVYFWLRGRTAGR